MNQTQHAAWDPHTGQWYRFAIDTGTARRLAELGWVVIGPGYGAHHTIPR